MDTTGVVHRVLEPLLRSLPPKAARQIANAQADELLQQRVEDLARKANEGELTADEQREYQAYVDAGDAVATMQAVARKATGDFSRNQKLQRRRRPLRSLNVAQPTKVTGPR